MSFGKMDDYSLSDLAGSGAIILASIGGLLTIILSSRCYLKCRLGLTDDCNLCMCERKPPVDTVDTKKNKKTDTPTPTPTPTPTDTPRNITIDPKPINFSFDIESAETIKKP
tara:strand:- start:125 stop:460 length:336 start_codon:yes stop_codon:yes gene_type:complete